MYRRIASLLVFLVGFAGASSAQQPSQFRTYSAENGLSQSVVLSVTQDAKGYLWVATEVGVNRFDGYSFTPFYREQGLPSDRTSLVYAAPSGRLWAGTEMGLAYWDGSAFVTPAFADTLAGISVISMLEDRQANLWVGTDGFGLWKFEDGRASHFSVGNGLAGDRIRALVEDRSGTVWAGTRDGLSAIWPDGKIDSWTMADGLLENRIRSLMLDTQGRLVIGSRGGVDFFENGRVVESYTSEDGLANNQVKATALDAFGRIWIATEEGFSVVQDGKFSNFGTDEGFGSSTFNCVFRDREGNMWIGTFGTGLLRYLGERFKSITMRDGLPDNMITAIQRDSDGTLWVSTYGGGVTAIDSLGSFTNWNTSRGLIDDRVFDLHLDDRQRLWVATRSGISILDEGEITNMSPETGLPFALIRTITPDLDGSLWFGTDGGGLIHFHSGTYENITTTEGLVHNTIRAVKQAPDGSLWVGTYGGLNRMYNGQHTHYTTSEGLPNNIVLDVMIAHDGAIWAGTFGGVVRLKDGMFTTYTSADGLPADVVYLIHQDKYNDIWLGTTHGLVRFNMDVLDDRGLPVFKRYTTDYGLAAEELNRGAGFGVGDTIWFGTVGGVSVYYRNLDLETSFRPPVYIEQIRVFDRNIHDFSDLTLGYRDNSLWFDFTALSFTAPEKVAYQYRLRPIDREWLSTDQRSVRYAGLPSGEYRFEVRARSNDGEWSESAASVRFTILPPFYSTWWFRLILAVGALALAAFVYNYYRVNKLVDLERMRVRIASDLHDDVGASLTEIALQTDFLQAYPIPDAIKTPLQQIGETSRRIVTTMDDIVWSIDARNDTVGDLTDRMQDYARNMLAARGIAYEFAFEGLDTGHSMPVEVRQNVYLIFKEMINNAVKHSRASRIDVRLSKHNNLSTLYIKDDGVGLANQQRKTGHGLKNLKLRAQRIGAGIEFIDQDGFGIQVTGKHIF